MRRLRHVLATTTATTLLLALAVFAAPSASAAQYDGTDPVSTGCGNTAVTIFDKAVGPDGAHVQLRYSTACRTTWAKLFGGNAGSPGDCAASFTYVHRNSDGKQYRATWNSADSGSIHSPQLNDANVTSYAFGSVDECFAGPFTAKTGSY